MCRVNGTILCPSMSCLAEAMFRVIVHNKALSKINSLNATDKRRVLGALKAMGSDPFSGDVKPVKGLRGVFRRRVGDHWIAFTVNFGSDEVVVLKVGRRGKFYAQI